MIFDPLQISQTSFAAYDNSPTVNMARLEGFMTEHMFVKWHNFQ